MLLKGKVVIVVGIGPGMGRKLGSIAVAEGAKVALAARTSSLLQEVATEIRAAGGDCITVPTDVTDEAQCRHLVTETVRAYGRVDGLVNSAYRPGSGVPFEEYDLESLNRCIDVTCHGALRMIKAVLPVMKAQKHGAIVNITALANVQPLPGWTDYAIAKSALEGATRQLAKELGPYNIRLNCARMGYLLGKPLLDYVANIARTQNAKEQDILAGMAARVALGVLPPDEDCARSALFFLSDHARMVTGATLDINGGEYMAA